MTTMATGEPVKKGEEIVPASRSEKQWIDSNGTFQCKKIPDVYPRLPPSVYELGFDAFLQEFLLQKIADKFELPAKVFGVENELIERVIRTFNSLDKNFGVVLKGLKGTGKTIVAKIICNRLKLPVILITKPWANIGAFINSIEQDVILLFDEFEKVYEFTGQDNDDPDEDGADKAKQNVNSLLSLMDGVFTSTHKRLFILTTNKDWLPDPMIARPSRIRYIKDFTDLHYEGIVEVLNSTVKNKALIPDLARLLQGLEIISVDIVKSIAEEANIYDSADPKLFEIFNIKRAEQCYDIYELSEKGGHEKRVGAEQQVPFEQLLRGGVLHIDGELYGRVTAVQDNKRFRVRPYDYQKSCWSEKEKTVLLKKAKRPHASMMPFAF